MNLEKKSCICYNADRQNEEKLSMQHSKRPRRWLSRVFFYRFFGWLNPKAGYQLLLSIQPFADIVAGYTSRNEIIILKKVIRGLMFLHQAALLIENIGLVQI